MEIVNLDEYEKILEDHGHISVYYPQEIIKKKFKEWLQECIMNEIDKGFKNKSELKKDIKERINKCFLGIYE